MLTKESNIKFWKNNQLDQEHEKSVEEVVSSFIGSEQESNYAQGMPFDRALLNHMGDTFGSFDTISDELWKAYLAEYRRQKGE